MPARRVHPKGNRPSASTHLPRRVRPRVSWLPSNRQVTAAASEVLPHARNWTTPGASCCVVVQEREERLKQKEWLRRIGSIQARSSFLLLRIMRRSDARSHVCARACLCAHVRACFGRRACARFGTRFRRASFCHSALGRCNTSGMRQAWYRGCVCRRRIRALLHQMFDQRMTVPPVPPAHAPARLANAAQSPDCFCSPIYPTNVRSMLSAGL